MSSIESRLREGLAHHRAGRLGDAEKAYRVVLERSPKHPDALYLLGTIHFQRGTLGSAALFLRRSLTERPDQPDALNSYGLVLLGQGKPAEAEKRFRRATQLRPDASEHLYNLGNSLRELGRVEEAADAFTRAVSLRTDFAEAHDHLALALRAQGRLADALASAEAAITANRALVSAHVTRGSVLKSLGRIDDAVASFDQAIALNGKAAEAYGNRGICQALLGNWGEAEEDCRKGLSLNPESPIAHNNLGIVLHESGRVEQAAEAFSTAVRLDETFVDARVNLGTALYKSQRVSDAIAAFRAALEIDPNEPSALRNLGNLLADLDWLDEAKVAYGRLRALDPTDRLLAFRVDCCLCPLVFPDSGAIAEYREGLRLDLERAAEQPLTDDWTALVELDIRPSFNLPFHGGDDRPLKEAFAKVVAPTFGDREPPTPKPGRPRIGFVVTPGHESIFLRSIGAFFGQFDPSMFQSVIVCSPLGQHRIAKELDGTPVEYLVYPANLRQAARAIAEAGLHLLYYFEVGTDALNYCLPFLRLAPRQCTSWGIQVTSGIPAMDYYISSRRFEPEDAASHYSEELLLLETMLSYQKRMQPPKVLTPRSHYGLPDDKRLYLCFQHVGKLHPDFDEILAGILREDNEGVVVLSAGKQLGAAERLRARFDHRLGEVAERIVLLPPQRGDDYSSLVMQADALLDPPHFGGVNSTYDGLSLNRPIVTMPSAQHRGRYTSGCYEVMGVGECVVDSQEAYIERATKIACDRGYRDRLEAELAGATSILFENPAAAGELADGLLRIAHGD
ncbi:Lipoprotein NlpI precursor [Planctomycetes bacterium Pan216]|uniref:protein O-GlcNAc transferase n=1 Tax=Kolteria novifilia TaxID=2527975 RepID=A0A518B218_9BACT|nr:Lipoprotein NlpI precursor [Planctomycetes bacterium Pan216]